MAQTLIDISHIKDETARTALDAIAQVLSNANFTTAGAQTTEVIGAANALLTTTQATGIVTMTATGTDTNVDIGILAAGTGTVKLAAGSFIANASIATVLGSLGPTGSHTAVQKWLQIKDNTGTVLFLPCF